MNRHLFSSYAIQQWCFRLIGLDVHMEPSPLGAGTFWKVETEKYSTREIEVWAFGRHFTVSRWDSRSRYC